MPRRSSSGSGRKSNRGIMPKHGENLRRQRTRSRGTGSTGTTTRQQNDLADQPGISSPAHDMLQAEPPSTKALLFIQDKEGQCTEGSKTVLVVPSSWALLLDFRAESSELVKLRAQATSEYESFCKNRPDSSKSVKLHPLTQSLLDHGSITCRRQEEYDASDEEDDAGSYHSSDLNSPGKHSASGILDTDSDASDENDDADSGNASGNRTSIDPFLEFYKDNFLEGAEPGMTLQEAAQRRMDQIMWDCYYGGPDSDADSEAECNQILAEMEEEYAPLLKLEFTGKYKSSRYGGTITIIEVDGSDPHVETFNSVAGSLSIYENNHTEVWPSLFTDRYQPEDSNYVLPTLFTKGGKFPEEMYSGELCRFRIDHVEAERKWNALKRYTLGADIYIEYLGPGKQHSGNRSHDTTPDDDHVAPDIEDVHDSEEEDASVKSYPEEEEEFDSDAECNLALNELEEVYAPLNNIVFKGRYISKRFGGSVTVIQVDENDPSISVFEDVGHSLGIFNTLSGKVWSGLCTDTFPANSIYSLPTIFAKGNDFPQEMYRKSLCKFRINHIEVEEKLNSRKGYRFGANITVECRRVYDRF